MKRMTSVLVFVAGVLGAWAAVFALRQGLAHLPNGSSLLYAVAGTAVWLAALVAGGIVAVRQYNLRR